MKGIQPGRSQDGAVKERQIGVRSGEGFGLHRWTLMTLTLSLSWHLVTFILDVCTALPLDQRLLCFNRGAAFKQRE